MRHQKKGRKLNRDASHRKALMRNLATSLLDKGRIKTTTAKAKEVRSVVERLITFAKRGDLHALRVASETVQNETVLKKLFEKVGPKYNQRNGGYTRIVKMAQARRGDAAEMAIIELVGYELKPKINIESKKEKQPKETVEENK
jgi:large subunit ribosomal protein L17